MARIELRGVGHSYDGGAAAVSDIDHVFEDGSYTALLGPSGCGKTTLLKAVSGLLRPSAGRITFDGVDVTERSPADRNIAQVFQFPVVYETMTVFDNLAFPLRNRGVDRPTVARRVAEVAELLDLSDDLRTKASRLAPYAHQRVALGRGLVRSDVAAILLDEPLTALDPENRTRMRRMLRQVHAELSCTFVHVTHDQSEAMTIADTVIVMNGGQFEQHGTPQELFERPATVFVGHFVGSPGMSFLEGAVEPAGTTLGIRPEHVELFEQACPGAIEGAVLSVEDRGHRKLVEVETPHGRLWVAISDAREVPARCWARLAPEHTRLFRDGRALG